ncbi:MAG TPA: LysM peptidoglycan-binding domain-containing protein [Bacteroidales bacterium]|nr:LysM peptidoglycan-binding domain-containing protein [Bacteroidales bacterium]HPT00974.1 LysM peptidoglycan-binding domain-containing protein [Bacteroidales bacterium]
MQKKFFIFLLIAGFLFQAGFAQEAAIKRSTVVEQYKGKPYYLHFVKQGETLFAIAKAYNVDVEVIKAENPDVEKEGLKVEMVLRIPYGETSGQPAAEKQKQISDKVMDTVKFQASKQQFIEHEVSKKETLYGISKQYGVTVDDLIKANPSMTELKTGMILKVPVIQAAKPTVEAEKKKEPEPPAPGVSGDGLIEVKQGQTLYSIEKQYNISEEELLRLNPELKDGLKTGQTIRLRENAGIMQKGKTVLPGQEKSGKTETVSNAVSAKPFVKNSGRVFEVALLLPLRLEMADSIIKTPVEKLPELNKYKTFDFFQFYAGAMIALDTLEKEGYRINFHVYDADSEKDTLKVKKALRRSEMAGMDLIIGPLYVKSFPIAARFASQHQIPIVNPLSRRNSILEKNPWVYKVYPGDQDIANALALSVTNYYPGANIISVCNTDKENKVMALAFADSVKKLNSPGLTLTQVIYQNAGFSGVSKVIDPKRMNIVILFSTNRSVVPAFVSKLNAYSKSGNVVLFGIPGWEDIEMETEFLMNMDYHQVVSSFVDFSAGNTKQFETAFREKYGAQPLIEKDAFLGYDIVRYFLGALSAYGKDFNKFLPEYNLPGLQYNFRFKQPLPANGYENTDARILHFKDYRWVEKKTD